MKLMYRLILIVIIGMLLVSCDKKTTSPEDEQVATPVFSPDGGAYDYAMEVLISCATPGAIIRYTTDGTEPTSSSGQYTALVQIPATTTLKAKAFKSGWISSSVKSATFFINTVLPPIITPPGGVFNTPQQIIMQCETEGAQIHYTTDGSVPTDASNLYTAPFTVSGSMVVNARAYLGNKIPSPVVSETYSFHVLPLEISPPGGSYSVPQMVSIVSPTAGVRIVYTLDASEPDETSATYTQPINITTNTILKVKAFKDGWDPSSTITAVYQINIADQMVRVEGGTFNNGHSDVTVSSFYIARYEATQFDWFMIMWDVDPMDHDLWEPSAYPVEDTLSVYVNLPVESISWLDAIGYCNWRSMAEGYTPCYSYAGNGTNPGNWPVGWNWSSTNHQFVSCNWNANGYRLPTEMEWMFAARGGNLSLDYIYSGSNNIDEVAWYIGNMPEPPSTQHVATKLPNELGIFDMSGNVWEYCWDIFAPLPTTEQVNPTGPATGTARVIKGGCHLHDAINCTVARRYNTYANLADNIMGFRVVRRAN